MAVFQMVAGEALMASGVVVFEYVEGEAGEAIHVHLIWGRPGGGPDGTVVSKFHVRQVGVPVVLSLTPVLRVRHYGPRDRLLLCRGASGSAQVTHTSC